MAVQITDLKTSQKVVVSKDEIKQARQANIAQYLMSRGVQLVKVGRRYKSQEHDSLVFTDNAYYWNSRQDKGNALDYVTKYMGMEFTAAVKELSPFSGAAAKTTDQEFRINDIELDTNIQRSIAYLNKSRCIDYKIIQDLVKGKLLYQSKEKANIVFPIRDEHSNIVGAELNGTLSDRRYKGIAENSTYGYGVNIRTSEISDLKNYMFFESTIDMLSYINIQHIEGNLKEFKNTLFVSMGGLKMNIVHHTLEAFKGANEPNIYFCVDNINVDKAAKSFCELACNELKDFKVSSMMCSSCPRELNKFPVTPSSGKDWNDQLKDMKKGSVQDKLEKLKEAQNQSTCNQEESKEKNHSPCR